MVRMVRMVRTVRSLADRTFQLWAARRSAPILALRLTYIGAIGTFAAVRLATSRERRVGEPLFAERVEVASFGVSLDEGEGAHGPSGRPNFLLQQRRAVRRRGCRARVRVRAVRVMGLS